MITVVGIGADGWDGLVPASRRAIERAEVLVGSARQLALLSPSSGKRADRTERLDRAEQAERVVLPSPLLPNLPALLESLAGRSVCVLASGDPLFYGIGTTLVRLLGAEQVMVLPHVSSVSLACARLGWPVEQVEVVSAVGRPLAALLAVLAPGRRVLVLGSSARSVISLLDTSGYGASRVEVLSDLGGPTESVRQAQAASGLGGDAEPVRHAQEARDLTGDGEPARQAREARSGESSLQVIAIECSAGTDPRSRVPGLPDEAFEHDGQLTKREVRAVSLSRLAPLPGELLWDVGAGAGSIAIEWMRTHQSCRAVAIESRDDRADRIHRNAATLGVPGLVVVTGKAPAALEGLPAPDAVFVGGGATVPGLLEACWAALRPGGRLVANAVTLESETLVAQWYGKLGGDLVRLAVQRASPVGGFTGWRAAMPVTVWTVVKGNAAEQAVTEHALVSHAVVDGAPAEQGVADGAPVEQDVPDGAPVEQDVQETTWPRKVSHDSR